MKKLSLTFALFIGLAFAAQAQTTKKNTRLVADETTLTETKTTVKVVTSNETIWKYLITKYKSNFSKYTVEFKRDRKGDYNEYTIPFKIEQLPEVEEFLRSL